MKSTKNNTLAKIPEKKRNVHAGHRQRVKERFDKEGLDNFSEHNVLEFLLFYAIPQKDTNVLAHQLLFSFGSIANVFDAKQSDLAKIVGPNAARLIKLIMPLAKKYYQDKENYRRIMTTSKEMGEYITMHYIGDEIEEFMLMCFDNKMHLIKVVPISDGIVSECTVNTRRICEAALESNASAVVMVHNHPNGLSIPSYEDRVSTRKVQKVLSEIGVELYDHIIVTERGFSSFADSGVMAYLSNIDVD